MTVPRARAYLRGMKKGPLAFAAVVVIGFLSRLLDHPDNFTPVIAMALVAGAFASRRYVAILLPLLAMLLSDVVLYATVYAPYAEGFLGLGSIAGNGFSYVALALLAVVPALLPVGLRTRWASLLGMGLVGSLLFYVVSNFGVWVLGATYPMTPAGLVACLAAGLPFLPATSFSTLLYGAIATAALKGFGVSPAQSPSPAAA